MKKLIFILSLLFLYGCEEPKEVYEVDIQTYVISAKEEATVGRYGRPARIYFQTSTSTECANVDDETYNKYNVGDTIQVLIKYWEKSKKNH